VSAADIAQLAHAAEEGILCHFKYCMTLPIICIPTCNLHARHQSLEVFLENVSNIFLGFSGKGIFTISKQPDIQDYPCSWISLLGDAVLCLDTVRLDRHACIPNTLTATTTTAILRPFVQDYPGELVPEKKTFTHSHLS